MGKNNIISPYSSLNNVKIENNNLIKMFSLIENPKISDQNIIGSFAYIRENTKIKNRCIIGAYAEVTRSFVKNRCYASHRVFISFATVNDGTIIGAGTVFCNYSFNNNSKSKTKIGKNCKIGSNVRFIAPINIR